MGHHIYHVNIFTRQYKKINCKTPILLCKSLNNLEYNNIYEFTHIKPVKPKYIYIGKYFNDINELITVFRYVEKYFHFVKIQHKNLLFHMLSTYINDTLKWKNKESINKEQFYLKYESIIKFNFNKIDNFIKIFLDIIQCLTMNKISKYSEIFDTIRLVNTGQKKIILIIVDPNN